MKRLTVMSLACLLSACVSQQTDLHQTTSHKAADFPVTASDLSDCVHRATETVDTSYAFRLHPRANNTGFSITATKRSHVITRRQLVGLELHFIPQGEATRVEMREGVTGGWWLAPKVWPLVERCAQ
jgi:hypothetical protein